MKFKACEALSAEHTKVCEQLNDRSVTQKFAFYSFFYKPIIQLRINIATPQALAFSPIFETRNLVSL